ncbi:MAG: DoxX family protein [Pseudobdellovibrionaceae bacterium]
MKNAGNSILLIRLLVGGVFLSEGIQKFLYPDSLGVGRFIKIGIPSPEIMAPFVGIVEIVFGSLLIFGILTRISAIPLLINISTAIITTKVPLFFNKGLWATLHEARVDYCMFLGLIFLIISGGGGLSVDRLLSHKYSQWKFLK